MRELEKKLIGIRFKANEKLNEIANKRVRGDSHFVAICIAIAVVIVIGIAYKGRMGGWFNNFGDTMESETNGMFNGIGTTNP